MAPTPRRSPRKPSKNAHPLKTHSNTKITTPPNLLHKSSNKAKPKGRQRHCLRCPGHPLRSALQCIHSAAYQALRKEAVSVACAPIPNNASVLDLQAILENRHTTLTQTVFETTGSFHGQPPPGVGGLFESESHLQGAVTNQATVATAPTTPVCQHIHTIQATGTTAPTTPVRQHIHSPLPPSSPPLPGTEGFLDHSPVSQTYLKDLQALSQPSDFTLSSPSNPFANRLDSESLCSTPTPASTDRNSKSTERKRPGIANPCFGHVYGVGKGPSEWKVPRDRELPSPRIGLSNSTKRYSKLAADLVNRCERISVETGCWLYMAALHPNVHEPFTHFCSQRLQEEKDLPVLDELHNTANKMYSVLQRARKAEAQDLAAELYTQKAENDTLREERDRLQMQAQKQQQLLDQLMAIKDRDDGQLEQDIAEGA